MVKVLVVEDEASIREMIALNLRLAGMEGTVVHQYDETVAALKTAMEDPDIAVVLMTQKLVSLCQDLVYQYKQQSKTTLIVEIPDRHGSGNIGESIGEYVKQAIGITI